MGVYLRKAATAAAVAGIGAHKIIEYIRNLFDINIVTVLLFALHNRRMLVDLRAYLWQDSK